MQHRCYGCMNLTEREVCEYCGYPAGGNNEPHQLPVGTLLRGQYTVGRVLGQGGFGITYLGWDEYLDTPVAIKEYFPSFLVNRESSISRNIHCYTESARPQYEKSKARFLREAKTLARFQEEPAIVRIRSFFEEHDTAYIVMEYVRGTDLANYVRSRRGKLTPAETLRILKPVMEALQAVHEAGLIHRDISPDNVMLHPRGGAKLLDFGAARDLDPDGGGRSTETVVKHGFAPVEQYQTHGKLGPWTDVYAMCATIWYCLTGQIPEEAITRLTEETAMDWAGIPGLTDRQRRTLERGMEVNRPKRIQSIRELIEGLYGEETGIQTDREQMLRDLEQELRPQVLQKLERELRPQIEAELRSQIGVELQKKASEAALVKPRRKKVPPLAIVAIALAVLVVAVGGYFLVAPSGWQQEGRYHYYYDALGRPLESCWYEQDGIHYYFDQSGRMQTGFCQIGDITYYFGISDGRMRTGWQEIDGAVYYFGEGDGRMRTGTHTIDGKVFDFGPDGKLR